VQNGFRVTRNFVKKSRREERKYYNTILLILQPKITVQSMHEKHRIQNTVEYNRTEQPRQEIEDRIEFMSLLRHVIDVSKAIKAAE
jgi:hypothetical protein